MSLAVFPVSEKTMIMPGRMSTAFFAMEQTMASMAETGLGVKDRT